MNRRFFLVLGLVFILVGMWGVMFGVQRVEAGATVYIRSDGSVDPVSANITTSDNVTYNFIGDVSDSLVIEREGIVVDGKGFRLEGTGFGDGITLDEISNVTVRNLEVVGFNYGIYLYNTSNNVFYGNNVTGNYYYGFYIYRSSNTSVYENGVVGNGEGSYHGRFSIYVAYCSNCTIRLNNISDNRYLGGIELWSSSHNNIYENNLSNNYLGILVYSSNNNTVYGNNITASSSSGFWLIEASNNILYDNLLNSNGYGFSVVGYEVGHYLNNVSVSNLVDGKPVYYLLNQHGSVINASTHPEVGWLALVNSTNVSVEGLNLAKNGQGLLLAYTNNSRIISNTIMDNYDGLMLSVSVNNIIYGNDIVANEYRGIYFSEFSDNNEILENSIVDNLYEGIYFSDSSNNVVYGNTIANSEYGIEFYGSNNEIYLNNFVNNSIQADLAGFANSWDNGVEGNYWSDYNGTDANLDGIGDSWRVFDANNTDHYPLMGMFSSFNTSLGYFVNIVSNSSVDSFEYFEGNTTIVMHVSNMTANQTGGFCRIRIPYSVVAEPFNVTIDGINPTYWNYSVYDDGANRWIYFNYQLLALEIVIVPELPFIGVIGLFMLTTLVATIFCRRKRLAWF